MIGLALSGGGARAMAFHLGCLRALEDLRILEKIEVLSTISGGSVVGAYYAYLPDRSFDQFEDGMRRILREGFHKRIALQAFNPVRIAGSFARLVRRGIGGRRVEPDADAGRRWYPSLTERFRDVLARDVFPGLALKSPRRRNLEVVIGACDLRTGSSFRFGSTRSGSWRLGEMIDGNVDVALAVAASAAYPIVLRAIDRTWKFRRKGNEEPRRVLLTDGGVYDNLGVQAIEPGRSEDFSLHCFPCRYVIACNAGMGQEPGDELPRRWYPQVKKSFATIHRRVQDGSMHRLHQMREAGLIEGFALPYLGQQDEQLPWKPGGLVPRHEVMRYPTNFAPMSESWIDRISTRGEQLTRAILSIHLAPLLQQ